MIERIDSKSEKQKVHGIEELFSSYRKFYKVEKSESASRNFILNRIGSADSIILASTSEGHTHICGFAQIYSDSSSLRLRTMWTLNDLYVRPECRRMKNAKELLNYIFEQAKSFNVSCIKLETAQDNVNAQELYKSSGYLQMGVENNFIEFRIETGVDYE